MPVLFGFICSPFSSGACQSLSSGLSPGQEAGLPLCQLLRGLLQRPVGYLKVSGEECAPLPPAPWCRKPRSFPGSSPASPKELSENGKLSTGRTDLQLLLSGRSGGGPPCLSPRVCTGMGLGRRLWDGSSPHSSHTPLPHTPPPRCHWVLSKPNWVLAYWSNPFVTSAALQLEGK